MTPEEPGQYFNGEYFSVPRSFEGETAVCIASGPSLLDDDVAYVRAMKAKGKCRVFVCNNNYLKVPEADVLFFCDKTFWIWHYLKPEYQAFAGLRVTLSKEIGEEGLKVMNLGKTEGLSFHPDTLRTGGNSGYMQINLAFLFGCKRVLLLGYDMKPKIIVRDNGETTIKTHWFGSHPAATDPGFYPHVAPHFESMIPDLQAKGLEVINCTRDTAIHCFPKSTIQESLK